jgi:rieske iron-sulfur protein
LSNKQLKGRIKRRTVLEGICAAGVVFPGLAGAQIPDPETLTPPQANDVLVHSYGDVAGNVIGIDELDADSKQIFAWAMDPVSGILRNGTRLNQVVLVRVGPDRLSDETAVRSINGLVAYSGVCSHTGCDVTDWNDESLRFQCPCHESQFDPADGARVVGGPAPWQLAALPLKDIDGAVGVARAFEGRVGFPQPGLSPFGI